MRLRGIAVMTVVGLFTLPVLAGAASQLTATGVRIGDHPAYVRVVVDFNKKVPAREVEAGRFGLRMANVSLTHPGVTTKTNGRTAHGVRVTLQPGTQSLHISSSFAKRRFKYLSYAVVTGNHLAIDLWKSRPPVTGAKFESAPDSCLALTSWDARNGKVSAKGSEKNLFEHTFRVVVRGAHGRVLGHKTLTEHGSWNTSVSYRVARSQAGTLEAVAFSPKDGALSCIAQVRVFLRAS
jgi:hypothetical protein